MDPRRGREVGELVLQRLGQDSSWVHRRVTERLTSLRGAEALLPFFGEALHEDDRPDRRNAARSALAALARPGSACGPAAVSYLADLLASSPDADVRLLVAVALGEAGNPAARSHLERALRDPNDNVAGSAAESLGLLGDRRAVGPLAEAAASGRPWLELAAILALGGLGDRRALRELSAALRRADLRSAATIAIGQIGCLEGLEALREVLEDPGGPPPEACRSVAQIIGANPEAAVPVWVRAALGPAEPDLIESFRAKPDPEGARLLGILGTPGAADALLDAFDDPHQGSDLQVGLPLLPPDLLPGLVLERVRQAPRHLRPHLLGLLPPLQEVEQIERVAELLDAEDPGTRAAAADVVARAAPEAAASALDRALADPARRAGAAVALGRMGGDRCLRLADLLSEPDPVVRTAAAGAMTGCGPAGEGVLIEAYRRETERSVREAILTSLGEVGGAEAVDWLTRASRDPDRAVRFTAARALGRSRSPAAIEPLLALASDTDAALRIAALNALGDVGDERASGPLAKHLNEPSREVRRTAMNALGKLRSPEVAERLEDALQDTDRQVRLIAVETARRLRGHGIVELLERRADSEPEPEVRSAITEAILDLRDAGS